MGRKKTGRELAYKQGRRIAADLKDMLEIDAVRLAYTPEQVRKLGIPLPLDNGCRFVLEWDDVRQHCPISLAVLADEQYEDLVKQTVIEIWIDRLEREQAAMMQGAILG